MRAASQLNARSLGALQTLRSMELSVPDFLAIARTEFEFLEREHGFRIVSSQLSESFGDGSIEFESSALRLRVLRDRLQWFVDASPLLSPPEWWNLWLCLQLVGASTQADVLVASGQRNAAVVASALAVSLDALTPFFALSRYVESRETLRALAQRRANASFGLV
jgi:hypothetical protein